MACEIDRPQRLSVNQVGRGHDPVTVVGSRTPSVTVNILGSSRLALGASVQTIRRQGQPAPPADSFT
jgi:hypothetical protein